MKLKIDYEEYKKLIRDGVHDSRNYLGLVNAYMTLLDKLYPDDKAKEYMKIINDSNKKSQQLMDVLVDKLLDIVEKDG